jgi:hypothetical protein
VQKHNNGNQIDVPFKLPDRDDVVLEKYCDDSYGFLLVHVTPKKLAGKFYSITSSSELPRKAAKKIDDFELDLQRHRFA